MLLNKERAYSIMDELGLDALVATTPANVTYLSDFRALGHEILDSFIFVILPREPAKDATLILPIGEAPDLVALKMSWIKDIRTYGTFYITVPSKKFSGWERSVANLFKGNSRVDALTQMKKALTEKGLNKGKIGIDERYFKGNDYEKVLKLLAGAKLVPANDIFRQIRMVKNREEVAIIREANRITEEGIRAVVEGTQTGSSGRELIQLFNERVTELGALPLAPTVALAEDSYLQYIYTPSPRKLRRGDLIRFDVACVYKHHYTDIGRNVVFGKASKIQKEYYNVVRKGEEGAIDAIRPGVKASRVFDAGVKSAQEAGMPGFKRHHCGHGIGLELYELPLIAPSSDTIIEEGSVINIETPYYEIGVGGFMLEDTVVVRSKGVEFLTKFNRNLYEIAN